MIVSRSSLAFDPEPPADRRKAITPYNRVTDHPQVPVEVWKSNRAREYRLRHEDNLVSSGDPGITMYWVWPPTRAFESGAFVGIELIDDHDREIL